jgi:hypothetical protein
MLVADVPKSARTAGVEPRDERLDVGAGQRDGGHRGQSFGLAVGGLRASRYRGIELCGHCASSVEAWCQVPTRR